MRYSVAMAMLLLAGCAACTRTDVQVASPDRDFVASVVLDGCGGATSGFYTDVVMARRLPWLPGRHVLSVRGEVPIKLEWSDARTLVVWYSGAMTDLRDAKVRVSAWEGVRIAYKPWLV